MGTDHHCLLSPDEVIIGVVTILLAVEAQDHGLSSPVTAAIMTGKIMTKIQAWDCDLYTRFPRL